MLFIIAEGIKLRTSKPVSNGTAKPATADNFVSNRYLIICLYTLEVYTSVTFTDHQDTFC